ncbi:MAG TPA: hypothetical protein VN665_00105, partial [Candidatus Paceibacterota bacterium]|nr:hypothetical protein [Candidatus Paceibacterota bacterium]
TTNTSSASNTASLQNTTAVGPATLGTATGAQMNQVNSELGLTGGLTGGGLVSDKVLIYNPSDNSAANNAAINAYIDYCENSGVISTASLGAIHYNVQPAYGGTFNAPGQNALVCVSN